ncbi:hypothetical protein SAMN05519105_4588 [Rhodobacter sp. 24-YEA-8]|nr:hypothetical protein SAMN05519105_4588 [Rhodobacter sp. 24-YEA-8]
MPVKTRHKGEVPRDAAKPSVLDDETYPADMEDERSEPEGQGDGKSGPRNPKTIPNPDG